GLQNLLEKSRKPRPFVIAGLVPAIQRGANLDKGGNWISGTSPGMTKIVPFSASLPLLCQSLQTRIRRQGRPLVWRHAQSSGGPKTGTPALSAGLAADRREQERRHVIAQA